VFKLIFSFMDLPYEGFISDKQFDSEDAKENVLDEVSEVLGGNCPEDISFKDFEVMSFSDEFDGFVDGTFSIRVVYLEYENKEDEEGTIREEIVNGNIVEV